MARIMVEDNNVVIKSYVLTALYDPTIHDPDANADAHNVFFKELYGYPLSMPRNPYELEDQQTMWINNEHELRAWCGVWFDTWHIREIAPRVTWSEAVELIQKETSHVYG